MDQKRLNCHLPHCNKNQEFTKRVDIYPSEPVSKPQMPSSLEMECGESFDKNSSLSSQHSLNSKSPCNFSLTSEMLPQSTPTLPTGKRSKSTMGEAVQPILANQGLNVATLNFQGQLPYLPYTFPNVGLNQISEELNKDITSSDLVS